jgi:hypothetical protein
VNSQMDFIKRGIRDVLPAVEFMDPILAWASLTHEGNWTTRLYAASQGSCPTPLQKTTTCRTVSVN